MKRLLFIFTFSFIALNFLWFTNSDYQVSEKIKIRVDGMMSIVDNQRWKQSTSWQLDRYQKIINSFSNIQLQWEQKEMIWYLLYLFRNKVSQLQQETSSQNETIKNIDWEKVQEEILKWHNDERSKKWLTLYTLNSSLNYSASTRAQQIANEVRKTGNTHLRKSTDRYYSTASIKNWFDDLWIYVDTFSESNAYWYYKCTKSDCTQEILSILKKCFNRTFLNAIHYPAVVSKIYDQIWIWVAKNGNWVWMTAHYGVNVK